MKKFLLPTFAILVSGSLSLAIQAPASVAQNAGPAVPVHVAIASDDSDSLESGDDPRPLRVQFYPLNDSGISGFAMVRTQRSGETVIHVVLHGLTTDRDYTLAWGNGSASCTSSTIPVVTLRGPRGGSLSWMGRIQIDREDISALTLWPLPTSGTNSVLSCAEMATARVDR